MAVYAIGDIHGRSDCLRAVFKRIDGDPARTGFDRHLEIYLGDFVDRGPDSRGVISLMLERSHSHRVVALRGNHEAMLSDTLSDWRALESWLPMGGLETLQSYGVKVRLPINEDRAIEMHAKWLDTFPEAHRTFLSSLALWAEEGDYYFCHAGIRPGVPLPRQSETDLLWIRDEFLESVRWHGKVIVHGHTPVKEPEILPHRINIDTGAYISGTLTCLRLDGTNRTVLRV